jgi:hypothetical protein
MNITIDRNGTKHGPYTLEQIKEYLGNGTFNEDDWAWYEGSTDWLPIKDIITPATTPPPPLKLAPPPPPVVPLKSNPSGPNSEPTQPRVNTTVERSHLTLTWKGRGVTFAATTAIQCIAWLICFVVLVLNGLKFFAELANANGAPQEAAAGAVTCTYFIGAYVFARVVEKICNLIAPK